MISRELGISLSAVSKAINNYPDISEQTKCIVVAKALELGYSPNLIARNLVKSTSNSIGIILKDISAYYGELFKPLIAAARKRNLNLILADTNRDVEIENSCIKSMIESRVLGIIIAPVNSDNTRIDSIVNHRIPVVYLGNSVTSEDENFVATDCTVGAELAINYLYNLGHREIALISDHNISNSTKTKIKVYKEFMEEHQLLPSIFHDDSEAQNLIESGYIQTKKMLADSRKFTAVYAVKDLVAVGAMKAFKEVGIRVPEDISVIGFDGAEFSSYPMINLTTIVQPKEEIAEGLIKILIELVHSKNEKPLHYIAKPNLVERGSCKKLS